MNFMEKLQEKIEEMECIVCLGMDPRFDGKGFIPGFLLEEHGGDPEQAILEFNMRILDAVGDIIPVIKPQMAYYEAFGAYKALKETISKARKHGILVILDGKRNDIGSTSDAYAKAMFERLKADACTLNPYLGSDCIKPFLKYKGYGIFVLVKTSNPSSIEFQDLFSTKLLGIEDDILEVKVELSTDENSGDACLQRESLVLERNYLKVARLVLDWSRSTQLSDERFGAVGAVIGATYPQQLKLLRSRLKDVFFLIPGFGFQGGKAEDIRYGFQEDGSGAVINSSRALLYAYMLSKDYRCDPSNFEDATKKEILKMNEEIFKVLKK
ncbi:MAG: orotidine-5'-phosphate decarboxylase [Promethearchaeota archaeon]